MRLRDLPQTSLWFLVKALKHILNQEFSALVRSGLDGSGRDKKFNSIHAPYPWTPRALPSSHSLNHKGLGTWPIGPWRAKLFPNTRRSTALN